jgi:hypothetical protein
MKQIKDLSVREFYNFLTCQIKAAQSLLPYIDDERLQDTIKNDPVSWLRDDITVKQFLECFGDDDVGK